jgi:hypothetical protein
MKTSNIFIKAGRKMLQLLYGFDKWHNTPLVERPYAVDIIEYCNSRLKKNTFAEIGCGLGDIIRNVDFKKRRGFDNDKKVLKGARILPVKYGSRSDVKFEVFNFPATVLKGKYDVLTMVNWIHHIEPDVLKKYIADYFENNIENGGEILIDTVQDDAYRYNHNIEYLTDGIKSTVYKLGDYAREREIFAIKKL